MPQESQISPTRNDFIFQLGQDPTIPGNIVECKIYDVFHKKIFCTVPNNLKGRVVSFIIEKNSLKTANPTVPMVHLKTWIMYLSQPTAAADWIGSNLVISRWFPNSGPVSVKINDNFLTAYEQAPVEVPDYTSLPFEPMIVGSTWYMPINFLKNQKVVGTRNNDTGPLTDCRFLAMYRPSIYYIGPSYPNTAAISTDFYAIAYESYKLSEPNQASQLSLLTNPRIKESFM